MESMGECAEAFDWIVSHWAFCAFIIGIVFEVPKWKFKPFTALFNWIGDKINRPVMAEIGRSNKKIDELKGDVEQLKKDVDALQKDVDTNEMDTIRTAVLDFANSCRNGRRHSKEEFDHIVALNDKYEQLLEKYDIRNGVYEADYKFVYNLRDKCQAENSFLA